MKKNFIAKTWLGITTLLLNLPVMALAQGAPPAAPPAIATDWEGLVGVFCKIINLLFAAIIALAIYFAVMAAYKYLTSAGEAEKISEANRELLYVAIAIVVALLAKGVPFIVLSIVGGQAGSVVGC